MIKNDLQIAPERWQDQEHSLDTITWTCFGLWTSNDAEVLKEVVVKGPSKTTEFSTVNAEESIVCEISPTFTSGKFPVASRGNISE
jgi:hypothetical protein